MKVLMQWTEEALKNQWREVDDTEESHEYVLVTDASGEGWGAVLLDERTGVVRIAGFPWNTAARDQNQKSTYAEPDAIARALCYFFPADSTAKVLILTDSSAAAAAYEAGRSLSYPVNEALRRVLPVFKGLRLEVYWIPGVTNVADAPSRGVRMQMDDEELLQRIRASVLGAKQQASI
jgi:hypothetical protein